jgi:CDP-diglyceride synthetase
MLGDLSESLLKRDMQRRTQPLAAVWGRVDVVDSLLLAAPVAYACWASAVGP